MGARVQGRNVMHESRKGTTPGQELSLKQARAVAKRASCKGPWFPNYFLPNKPMRHGSSIHPCSRATLWEYNHHTHWRGGGGGGGGGKLKPHIPAWVPWEGLSVAQRCIPIPRRAVVLLLGASSEILRVFREAWAGALFSSSLPTLQR